VSQPSRWQPQDEFLISEETYFGFAFIAGFTAGGAPYGITIEEAEALAGGDFSFSDALSPGSDEDIPF
jgi:hypothetical protein